MAAPPLAVAWLLATGLALGPAACAGREPAPATEAPAPEVSPVPAAPSPADLVFADPAKGQRHRGLRVELLGAVQGGVHLPLARIGNFLTERWCSDEVGAAACERGLAGRTRTAGAAWWELTTLHYPDRYPQVFGLSLQRGQLPADGGLGLVLSLVEEGGTVAGAHLSLHYLAPGTPGEDADLWFGDHLAWTAADTTLRVAVARPGEPPTALLARLLASPEALRAAMHDGYQALEAEVLRALEAGEVTREELQLDQYQGDGVPPPAVQVALTAEERRAEAARVQAVLGQRRARVEAEAATLYRLLRELTPQILVPAG